MKNITREFWYGNILPQTDCRPQSAEFKELNEYIALHHNELSVTLTDKQREILDKLDGCWDKYINLTEEAIFSYAFKLGLKMAAEAFAEKFNHD